MLLQLPISDAQVNGREATVPTLGLALVPRFLNKAVGNVVLELVPGQADAEAGVLAWLQSHPEASVSEDASSFRGWSVLGPPAKVPGPARGVPPTRPVPPLATLKALKGAAISGVDARSDSLIANGFTVDGKVFSASDAAQLKWLGMYTSRVDLSYPVTVPTKDDTQFVSLIEAADVATYYAALLARIQTVLTGGVTLKALIAATTTQAELDAVVDNRT